MAIRIARQQTASRQVNDAQGQAQRVATAMNQFPLQPGVLVVNQTFTVGTNTVVTHGLKRPINGWQLLRIRNYMPASGTPSATEVWSDSNFLTLGPFANFTADVWVY